MTKLSILLAFTVVGCVAADDTDPETGTTAQAENVYQWTDDTSIYRNVSAYQPGLAGFGGRVHMVHTFDGGSQLQWSRYNGDGWTDAENLAGQYADYGPALTVYNNRLALLYHVAGQGRFAMSTSDGHTWTTPITAGVSPGTATFTYAPAAAVHGGVLYMAYCEDAGSRDVVAIDRYTGTGWARQARWTLDLGWTCKHVALASLPGGDYDLIWTQANGSSWSMFEVSGDGQPTDLDDPVAMTMKSKKPPSIVTCGTTTHLVHGGYSNPNEIWWSYRVGSTWSTNVKVPDQASSGGAALGCFQDSRAILVHNGGDSILWWSEYLP